VGTGRTPRGPGRRLVSHQVPATHEGHAALAGLRIELGVDLPAGTEPVDDAGDEPQVHPADDLRCRLDDAVERAVPEPQAGIGLLGFVAEIGERVSDGTQPGGAADPTGAPSLGAESAPFLLRKLAREIGRASCRERV